MRIVYMGTPEFALPALERLIEEHEVVCVYTRAPKPKGRGNKLTPSIIDDYARSNDIEVRTPKTLRNNKDEWEYLKSLKADVGVVAAYGLILPKEVMEAFPHGCLNLHGSLLPKWRGAAPVERSMMALDEETGITIMQIDEGLDTGDMIIKGVVKIDDEITSEELRVKLAYMGADLISKTLQDIEKGNFKTEKQPVEGFSIAPKIEKNERLLDFNDVPRAVLRKIKAIGGYFVYKGENFNVIDAKLVDCDESQVGKVLEGFVIALKNNQGLKVTRIQRQGKNAMPADAFLRGFKFDEGTVL
ncbi:MAG: Methionyl-tRNA formyltransferase [Alphaproteobacteria bacterium ADurb.Bin438]|nr:MAG: Methionyl-tRNA formyltransferase [Alphaproteobacteria bacterium ADurb.Bin438]